MANEPLRSYGGLNDRWVKFQSYKSPDDETTVTASARDLSGTDREYKVEIRGIGGDIYSASGNVSGDNVNNCVQAALTGGPRGLDKAIEDQRTAERAKLFSV